MQNFTVIRDSSVLIRVSSFGQNMFVDQLLAKMGLNEVTVCLSSFDLFIYKVAILN